MSSRRHLPGLDALDVQVIGAGRSVHYARLWLELLGAKITVSSDIEHDDGKRIVIMDGSTADSTEKLTTIGSAVLIRLWDFQVDRKGSGFLAGAVSGAVTVIGRSDGLSVALPTDLPEKWCGAYGAILALAESLRAPRDESDPHHYDVSSADVLRSFALQNAGAAQEMAALWRRNGRIPVQHGGIFPMGFFPCKDGYVALLGRSRRDWKNIREALDDPEWARDEAYADPLQIARDSARADEYLEGTLREFTRADLLQRGLQHNAVIAPVYSPEEAANRAVFRDDFFADGEPSMPMLVRALQTASFAVELTRSDSERPGRTMPNDSELPLSGLRVIELCWVWSGPLVGQTLADLGAEVIKVESNGRFDLYRTRGLEHRRGEMPEAVRIESSIYFHSLNRNKTGLTLDLKSTRGMDVLRSLLSCSDLLLDNFTAGTLERLGLTDDVIANANPTMTVLSMSGPGRESALQALRSYGLVLSALGGIEHGITSDGEFVGSPTYSISDPNAALFATLAALGGVLANRSGTFGLGIDISQIEAAGTLAMAPPPSVAADRYIAVLSADGVEVGLSVPPDVSTDDMLRRTEGLPLDAVVRICDELGVGCVPVTELLDTESSTAFRDCSGYIPSCHPVTGDEPLVAAPWRYEGRRAALRRTAPILGQGNEYVLCDVLGLSADALDD